MDYSMSQLDRDNLEWFANDVTRCTLKVISLQEGRIRGLHPFTITFTYPLTVIAGRNGSGKSTILALAACAFHNHASGFKRPGRALPYYRFSDFFVQSAEEVPPQGVSIFYGILYNKWKVTPDQPKEVGLAYQERRKERGGKWNDYEKRVDRNVVVFGIDRVVPHSEKSVSKSYRRSFADQAPAGWEEKVQDAVGQILGIRYEHFRYKAHSKYRLPIVQSKANTYSGFNMGAGENALFEIFSTIFSCPEGALLIVDEIELGLHEQAQIRLIEALKLACKKRKLQIICTTHSYCVLKCVPPDARFYVESFADKTEVTPRISARYAAGKLAGENSKELDVYLEDATAGFVLEAALSRELRSRINLIEIGSSQTVVGQMSARYRQPTKGKAMAILDGDQRELHDEHLASFSKPFPKREEARTWIADRLTYLPGNTWPERWLLEEVCGLDTSAIEGQIGTDSESLKHAIEEAIQAGKHDEFYSLSQQLHLDADHLKRVLASCVAQQRKELFEEICDLLERHLDA